MFQRSIKSRSRISNNNGALMVGIKLTFYNLFYVILLIAYWSCWMWRGEGMYGWISYRHQTATVTVFLCDICILLLCSRDGFIFPYWQQETCLWLHVFVRSFSRCAPLCLILLEMMNNILRFLEWSSPSRLNERRCWCKKSECGFVLRLSVSHREPFYLLDELSAAHHSLLFITLCVEDD